MHIQKAVCSLSALNFKKIQSSQFDNCYVWNSIVLSMKPTKTIQALNMPLQNSLPTRCSLVEPIYFHILKLHAYNICLAVANMNPFWWFSLFMKRWDSIFYHFLWNNFGGCHTTDEKYPVFWWFWSEWDRCWLQKSSSSPDMSPNSKTDMFNAEIPESCSSDDWSSSVHSALDLKSDESDDIAPRISASDGSGTGGIAIVGSTTRRGNKSNNLMKTIGHYLVFDDGLLTFIVVRTWRFRFVKSISFTSLAHSFNPSVDIFVTEC